MKKLRRFILFLLLPFLAFSQETAPQIKIQDVSPAIRDHLNLVIGEMSRTQTGNWLFARLSPQPVITAKPLAALGNANAHNVITLESLRLNNQFLPETSTRQKQIKLCFTAEILAHELLHNAQFHAGLMNFPSGISGTEAVLLEKILELQADCTGKKMYYEMRGLPDYEDSVPEKPGLYLFMQRTSQNPAKEYLETLWCNMHTSSAGQKLFIEQVREIAHWNNAYNEQAVRNHARRFLVNGSGDPAACKAHLQKIIDFTSMPVTADFMLQKAPVQAIPYGIAAYENGRKVRELRVKH